MLLKELCLLNAVSGNEKPVRDYIRNQLTAEVDSLKTDKMGNLLAEKNRTAAGSPRVVISAHMDEIGLFITEITSEGYLKFLPVGRIDPIILTAKPVRINEVYGVIGSKAIHLQKPDERKQILKIDQLYIDIGASSKEEAEEAVKPGDYAVFTADFNYFGSDYIKSKALDNRAGCAVIMQVMANNYLCDLTAVFTVQEETGLRGSQVVSNYLAADLAVIIETTKAADIMEAEREDWIVELGQGPACSIMDSATIYKPELIRKTVQTAREKGIPIQLRQGTAAANDAGKIHLAGSGIPVVTISIPCRYIHTMNSVISRKDYDNCLKLLDAILSEINDYVSLLSS